MGAGAAHAHEHGASAVDIDAERVRAARRLGLALVLAGALLCAGGLWLFSFYQHVERVEPADRSVLDARLLKRIDAALAGVDREPRAGLAHAELARVYSAGGLAAEALAAYAIAARLDPGEPTWELYAALAELQLGQPAQARERLARVCVAEPQFAAAQWWSAELARRVGDMQSARAGFERCAELSPERPEGLAGLGRVALDSGDAQLACTQLERALEVDAGFKAAQRLLRAARNALERGSSEGSQESPPDLDFVWIDAWGARAFELSPDLEARRERVRELIDEGRLEQATRLCLALLDDQERDTTALLLLVQVRLLSADLPGAQSALEELRRLVGDGPAVRELQRELDAASDEQDSDFSPPDR